MRGWAPRGRRLIPEHRCLLRGVAAVHALRGSAAQCLLIGFQYLHAEQHLEIVSAGPHSLAKRVCWQLGGYQRSESGEGTPGDGGGPCRHHSHQVNGPVLFIATNWLHLRVAARDRGWATSCPAARGVHLASAAAMLPLGDERQRSQTLNTSLAPARSIRSPCKHEPCGEGYERISGARALP